MSGASVGFLLFLPWLALLAIIFWDTRDANGDRERRKERREVLTLIGLFLTVALTFGTLLIFYFQLREMQNAYGPIQKSATAAIIAARAAETQAVAAAKATFMSLNAQRARINFENVVFKDANVENGTPPLVEFDVTNAGPTPAILIVGYYAYRRGITQVFDERAFPSPLGGKALQKDGRALHLKISLHQDDVNVLPPKTDEGRRFANRLIGKIVYRDIFDNEVTRYFCYSDRSFGGAGGPCTDRFTNSDKQNYEVLSDKGSTRVEYPP